MLCLLPFREGALLLRPDHARLPRRRRRAQPRRRILPSHGKKAKYQGLLA